MWASLPRGSLLSTWTLQAIPDRSKACVKTPMMSVETLVKW